MQLNSVPFGQFFFSSIIVSTQLNTVILPQFHNKLREEAKQRGEMYKVTQLRRNIEMDDYDFVHWRRSFEEREALIRDISR